MRWLRCGRRSSRLLEESQHTSGWREVQDGAKRREAKPQINHGAKRRNLEGHPLA